MAYRPDRSDIEGCRDTVSLEFDPDAIPNPEGEFKFDPTPVAGWEAMKCRVVPDPMAVPMDGVMDAAVKYFKVMVLGAPVNPGDLVVDKRNRFRWPNQARGGEVQYLYVRDASNGPPEPSYWQTIPVWMIFKTGGW